MARKTKTTEHVRQANPYPLEMRPATKWHIKIGPPGTGKTEWIKRQVERAVLAYGPDLVLLASFSNAAVAELSTRIGLPWENTATIHGHAYRSIGRPQLTEGAKGRAIFNQYCQDIGEDWAMLGDWHHSAELDDLEDPTERPTIDDGPAAPLYAQYQIYRARQTEGEEWDQDVWQWAQIWNDHKYILERHTDEDGTIDYDMAEHPQRLDFPDVIDQALRTTTVAPGDPIIMFVDEGQDLSAHQVALVKHWGARCLTVVFVCDPDQNLYEWAGTDPEAVWSLPVPPENITVLAQSYRVPRQVHDWAVWWISQTPNRRPVEYYPTAEEGRVMFTHATYEQPAPIIDQVEEWLADPDLVAKAEHNGTPNGHPIAMLLTTCGYMLQPILAELRSRGIKYFNPYRIKRGDWQWPSTASARRLQAYLWAELIPSGTAPSDPTVYEVWQWAQLLDAKAFAARGVKTAIEALNTEEETRNDPVSFTTLINWLGEDGAFKAWGGDLDWLEANMLESKVKAMAGPIAIVRQHGPQALLAAPQVVVSTYYGVKGGVTQNAVLFPDLSPSAEREAHSEAGEAAIRRLVYVGATRSLHGLYLASRASTRAIQWGDWLPLAERNEQ